MYKADVTLTNNTGGNIIIGNFILSAGQVKCLWKNNFICGSTLYLLNEIISNIGVINSNINNGNLILKENTVQKNALQSFLILDKILSAYNSFLLNDSDELISYFNRKIPLMDGYTQIWWTMDSTTEGLKNQGVGGDLDLVLNTGTDTVAVAPMGECRIFDRQTCFKSAPTTIGESSGSLTISFWANFFILYDAVVVAKMYYGNDNWGDPYMSAGIYEDTYDSAGSRMRLWISPYGSSTTQISNTNSDIEPGWHLHSFVFNSSTGLLQQVIDGCVVAQQTLSASSIEWWTHGRWVVGGNINGSANIRGKICHISVENTARSLQYLKDMYKQGLS